MIGPLRQEKMKPLRDGRGVRDGRAQSARREQMPQSYLAPHAITVGVDMRGEHDPAAGCEHRGDLAGRARALGGNRDSVRGHGIKIKQKRQAEASRKDVTQERHRYGIIRVPTRDRRWPATVPLTARLSLRSRYVPTNCVGRGLVKLTVIASELVVVYVPL